MPPPLRWTPWLLLGVFGALVALVGVLAVRGTILSDALWSVPVTGGFAVVGAVLATRRPRNAIGWLCLGLALLGASQLAAHTYARHGLIADPGSLPGAHLAAWWSGWPGTPTMVILLMLLPLLFPTGRPPSERWRPVLWLVVGLMVVGTLATAFSPGPIGAAPEFVNPLGLEVLGEVPKPVLPLLLLAFIGTFLTLIVLSLASLVARYRRAQGPERQQLKWFFYAFLLVIGLFLIGTIGGAILSGGDPVAIPKSPLYVVWWSIVSPATILTVPIAIGIAILRYRLYDIDLIINRTLVYGALSATLLAAYVVLVLTLSALLRPLTGSSDIAVAASTLAVVAGFGPLRARFQRVVDRRFYRSRYDAERTVARFSGRLRDELDLAALSAELIGVVGETVRPARAGIWLRGRS